MLRFGHPLPRMLLNSLVTCSELPLAYRDVPTHPPRTKLPRDCIGLLAIGNDSNSRAGGISRESVARQKENQYLYFLRYLV